MIEEFATKRKKRWRKHSFIFFCVGFVGWEKMKVCFVRWHKIFVRWLFLLKLFSALALKAVPVVVHVIPKMFVQSTAVSSLQVANSIAGNEEGINEVIFLRD